MVGKAARHTKGMGGVIGHIPRQEQLSLVQPPQDKEKKSGPAHASGKNQDSWVMPEIRAVYAENAQLRADNMLLRGEIARLRMFVGEDAC